MSNFFKKIIEFIASLFKKKELSAIKIKGKVFMPLFYPGGKPGGTWVYLSLTVDEQKHARDTIKSMAVKGETPAIVMLLNPSKEAGNIWNNFPAINQQNLNTAIEAIKECIKDGIAVFLCLYNDDTEPRWYHIDKENILSAWKEIHRQVGKYVTGYVLSIETNEMTRDVGTLQHMIHQMKTAMPGADYYSTHLQWLSKGLDGYRWIGGTSTPNNINALLVEFTWHPDQGDKNGVTGVTKEYKDIVNANPGLPIIWHEFNRNSGGQIMKDQREYLRKQNPWGVG